MNLEQKPFPNQLLTLLVLAAMNFQGTPKVSWVWHGHTARCQPLRRIK